MAQLREILRKLNPRERMMACALLSVAGLLLAKVLVINEIAEFVELKGRTRQVREEIARSRAMIAELGAKQADRRPASDLQDYQRANSGLGNFIRKVSAAPRERREFSVRKIASQKMEHLPEYDKTQLEIEVEGPFQQIGAFLEELESSRFLTRVESIRIFRIERELRLCRARILVDNFSWRDQ